MHNVQETDCMRAGRCIGRMATMAMAMVLYRRGTLRSWQAVTVPGGPAHCCRGLDPSWQCSAVREGAEVTKESATKTHGRMYGKYSTKLLRIPRYESGSGPCHES
jgi:hypothetical protein